MLTPGKFILAVITVICLGIIPAWAHDRTEIYDRNKPVQVVVRTGMTVHVVFDHPIMDFETVAPADAVDIERDPNQPRRLIITGLKPVRNLVYVRTEADFVYALKMQWTGHIATVLRVKDRYQMQASAEKLKAEAQPSGGLDPQLEALWYAQWGMPRKAGHVVQKTEINEVIKDTSYQRVTLVRRYETAGYYGFTQRIENLSGKPITIHPARIALKDGSIARGVCSHKPAILAGEDPYELKPGSSVNFHTTYRSGGDAPFSEITR